MTRGGDRPSKRDSNFDSANLQSGISVEQAAKVANMTPGGNGSNQHKSNSANLQDCTSVEQAAKVANMTHGGNRKGDQPANLRVDISAEQAAAMFGASLRNVEKAKAFIPVAHPELLSASQNFPTASESC